MDEIQYDNPAGTVQSPAADSFKNTPFLRDQGYLKPGFAVH